MNMKKFTSILLTLLSLFVVFFSAPNAHAVYNASDVIGQIDSADITSYTSATANNGDNAVGMNSPWDIALDTTNHRLFVADAFNNRVIVYNLNSSNAITSRVAVNVLGQNTFGASLSNTGGITCLLYTSPSPRDRQKS